MIDPRAFLAKLDAADIDMFCGVPDSLLKNLCACITSTIPSERAVIAANEGNAVGMACGYHLSTGKTACVYMQNSGEGNVVNPVLSIADPDVYSIPMLLIIGWRGEPGVHDEPQHVKQGKVTCSLLETMDIPYAVLHEDWERQLDWAINTLTSQSRPVAVVVRKGTFDEYGLSVPITDDPLSREEALEEIIRSISPDDVIVSTTGKTSREVFEIRERRSEGHEHDFLTVGGMGHTSSIAYGVAIGTKRDVWCLDGDGSLLMHMGALAIIAQNMPDNLHYVVNNNGAHESVGGQPTVARNIDVPAILRACGFAGVVEASTKEQIAQAVAQSKVQPGYAIVLKTHQGSRDDLGRPTTTPQQNKEALMALLAKD